MPCHRGDRGGPAAGCGARPVLASAPGGDGPVTPACAWPYVVNADAITTSPALNFSNPDTAADYWIMEYTVQPGLRITLSGRYPGSRYMSFEAYASDGAPFTVNGVSSALPDYRIAPDPGSVNPWQREAGPGGRFTLTLQSSVTPGRANTLPLAPAGTPAGTIGAVFFRVYAAHGSPGRVPLPAVTFTRNGISKRLRACPFASSTLPAGAGQPSGTASAAPHAQGTAAGIVPFARYPSSNHTPDSDQAYLTGRITPPQDGDVLLIRAKAPAAPDGSWPSPWPMPGEDMRYWSLCIDVSNSRDPVVVNTLANGTADYGCRYDSQARLDRNGYYTFAVGTESQRAAIERVPGVTFLPFSAADPAKPHVLFLRNMLSSPGFSEAVQDVPANRNAASAAAVMGPYYPRMALCPLAGLTRSGPDACLGWQS